MQGYIVTFLVAIKCQVQLKRSWKRSNVVNSIVSLLVICCKTIKLGSQWRSKMIDCIWTYLVEIKCCKSVL